MWRAFACVVVVALAGCPAPVGSERPIPKDSTAMCSAQCASIGLELDSVVIMASNIGCVCRPHAQPPPGAPPGTAPDPAGNPTSRRGGSTGGGVATVMMHEAAAQQQRQQQQRRR